MSVAVWYGQRGTVKQDVCYKSSLIWEMITITLTFSLLWVSGLLRRIARRLYIIWRPPNHYVVDSYNYGIVTTHLSLEPRIFGCQDIRVSEILGRSRIRSTFNAECSMAFGVFKRAITAFYANSETTKNLREVLRITLSLILSPTLQIECKNPNWQKKNSLQSRPIHRPLRCIPKCWLAKRPKSRASPTNAPKTAKSQSVGRVLYRRCYLRWLLLYE